MGFSAGGTVTAAVAYNYSPETRPDLAAPIYLQYEWVPKPDAVPADAPPMFILAATDDPLGLAPHSVNLYRDWTSGESSTRSSRAGGARIAPSTGRSIVPWTSSRSSWRPPETLKSSSTT